MKICPQCGTEYELDQRFCPKDGSTLKMQGGQTGDLVGSIIADRYSIMKKLGEGGMGTVYLAEHVKMGRKSAVKVMNPGMVHDADAISRFNREAANASRINHPNVAAVYDFGETSDGLIYLAMEFIEGPSLTKVIDDSGSLPPARAAEITRQAAEALAVAHDMGIVHRDLKPDNIMLAKSRDGGDIVKVVDFGIAKAAAEENQKVTKTGLVVGTPEYMSPEQLAGDKLDGRSDTYSLALVAFAMLTGKLPFPAETVQESMIKRLTDSPQQLAEARPEIPWSESIQAVMNKALERDLANRYQTASEFGRALHQAVNALPQAVRNSGATAVISSVTPTAASPAVKQPTPVPPTRVNPATPSTPPKSVPAAPAAKSRVPLMAAAAVVLVVVGSFGAWKMFGPGSSEGAQLQGTQLNQPLSSPSPAPATPAAPEIPFDRQLERLGNIVLDSPQVVLTQLRALDAQAQASADSSFLIYRYLRGQAIMTAGDTKAGCDSLSSIEGKLKNSKHRLYRADSGLLVNYCR